MTRVTPTEQRQTESCPRPHEHGWIAESRHSTSDGYVIYMRCFDCGIRRVDLQVRADTPPTAVSAELAVLF